MYKLPELWRQPQYLGKNTTDVYNLEYITKFIKTTLIYYISNFEKGIGS